MSGFREHMAELRARAEAERQAQQQKQQPEKERVPTHYQKQREMEGNSEWSGGRMGGGTIAGRSR